MPTRVLIIDDSSFMRRALTKLLEKDTDLEIVGTAENGREGLEKIKDLDPDVVTLDVQMPVLDGLSTLRELQKLGTQAPPILVCSSLTAEGSHEALEAMRLGAADFITKDAVRAASGEDSFTDELTTKVKAVARRTKPGRAGTKAAPAAGTAPAQTGTAPRTAPVASLDPALEKAISGCRGVVIGSSTGGPPVLEQLVCAIPASCPVPVVIAQHMPALFTKSLAERLDRIAKVRVTLVDKAMLAEPGNVYIARGGDHARVVRRAGRVTVEPTSEPTDAMYKPSADALFTSAAKAWAAGGFAIVITGMGADGSEGAKHMKEAGATIVAQNEETSVVYGMPRAVAENGTSSAALTPNELAALLSKAGAASSPATAGSFLKQSA